MCRRFSNGGKTTSVPLKYRNIASLSHLTMHSGNSLGQSDERLELSDGDSPRRLQTTLSSRSADAASNVSLTQSTVFFDHKLLRICRNLRLELTGEHDVSVNR